MNNKLKIFNIKVKKTFLFVALLSFIINILMLTPTLYMLQLYDRVVTGKSIETLFMLTFIIIFVYIFLFLLDFLRHKITIRIANIFENLLNEDIFKSIFKWSMLEPSKANSAPLKDLFQIRQFISSNILLSIFDLPWTLIYILVLFLFHPLFGWFAILSIIVLGLIALLNEKYTKNSQEESNSLHHTQINNANSYLQNNEIVHSMGILNNIHNSHKQINEQWLESQTITNDLSTLFTNLSKYSRILFQSLILGIGAYLVIIEELSPGMMIAGSILLGRVLAPIDIIVGQWKQIILSRKALFRIKELLKNISINDDNISLPQIKGHIKLENITSITNDNIKILNNINLVFSPSKITCLIGESGSGKSTLVRSILGLVKLNNGNILIDNAKIDQYHGHEFSKNIGYLPQDIELFDGTIAQNIACMGDIDDDAVIEAAKFTNTHEMILALPNGYNTKIGQEGIVLSGGQRQRIAIARTIYNNPKIIILDEPNSNLDDKGDLSLVQTLEKLKQLEATIIIITHKMNIVQYANEVVIIKNGTIQSVLSTNEFFNHINNSKISNNNDK